MVILAPALSYTAAVCPTEILWRGMPASSASVSLEAFASFGFIDALLHHRCHLFSFFKGYGVLVFLYSIVSS